MTHPTNAPKRASVLTRVSTEDQADGTSLAEQRRLCIETIERLGWQFTGTVYEDAGVSGTLDRRPGLDAAMRDAREGGYDVLVIYNLTRLARKMSVSVKVIEELNALGIGLKSVQENLLDTSTPTGQAMAGIFASFAQLDRDQIVERTTMSKRTKARNGGWPGGQPPFGWRLEDMRTRNVRPVPDERERELIRYMYNLAVRDGLTTAAIADRLNAVGVPTRQANQGTNSGKWAGAVVRRILTNPALWNATYIWGGTKTNQAANRSRTTRLNRDGTPKYGEPIPVPMGDPVMTREEFDALGRALADHNNAGRQFAKPTSQVLTGLIYGACGKPWTGTNIKGKDPIYRCTGNRHRGKHLAHERCGESQVNARLLDERVKREVIAVLTDRDRLEAMAREWLKIADDADDGNSDLAVRSLEERIRKTERALERAEVGVLMSETDDDFARHQRIVARMREELRDLRAQLEVEQARYVDARTRADQFAALADLVERAQERLQTMSREDWRRLVLLLDLRVTIGDVHASEPRDLRIEGRIDPRLFGDGPTGGPETGHPPVGTPPASEPAGDTSGGSREALPALAGARGTGVAGPRASRHTGGQPPWSQCWRVPDLPLLPFALGSSV